MQSGDSGMAILIRARKMEESDNHVRYEYSVDDMAPKTIYIDLGTGSLLGGDPPENAAGKIYMKIMREWESSGEFPVAVTYAS